MVILRANETSITKFNPHASIRTVEDQKTASRKPEVSDGTHIKPNNGDILTRSIDGIETGGWEGRELKENSNSGLQITDKNYN